MSENAKIRCKFECVSARKWKNRGGKENGPYLYEYEFSAVYEGSEENKKYFAYTPSGNLKISAFRDDLFEPGKEYYLDLIPVN